MMINCVRQPLWKNPTFFVLGFPSSLQNARRKPRNRETTLFKCCRKRRYRGNDNNSYNNNNRGRIVCGGLFPVDPWAPTVDSQSIASQLFGLSLFPYIGFLYFITKSKSAPKLTLFGFYFLLAFVGATRADRSHTKALINLTCFCALISFSFGIPIMIAFCISPYSLQLGKKLDGMIMVPAGIYAKVHYGTSLSNVDWLHGGAESLLTLTNLFIVMGLREALRKAKEMKANTSSVKEEKKSSV